MECRYCGQEMTQNGDIWQCPCGASTYESSMGQVWYDEDDHEIIIKDDGTILYALGDGSYTESKDEYDEYLEYEDEGEMPLCCTACGNPLYPDCMDSCKNFDD